jgi:hypothetical protein
MPEILLLWSKAIFAAAGCGAGVRLAQIARREGGVPLHAWGCAMVFAGGFGLLGFGLGPALAKSSRELARDVMIVGDALGRLVTLALTVFVWRVFGAGSAARRGLLGALLVLLGANWVRGLLHQSWPEPTPPLQRFENQLVLALPFVWSALETRIAFARSRRQLALGLTDAVTSNRFVLWSAASASFAAIGFAAAAAAVAPPGAAVAGALTVLQALLFVAIAGIVALAFFPPATYLRWLAKAKGR